MGLSMSIMSRDLGSEWQWHVKAVWLCEPFRAHLWPCCGRHCQSPGWVGFGYLLEGESFGKSQEWRLLSSQILSRSETSLLISRSLMQPHRGLCIEYKGGKHTHTHTRWPHGLWISFHSLTLSLTPSPIREASERRWYKEGADRESSGKDTVLKKMDLALALALCHMALDKSLQLWALSFPFQFWHSVGLYFNKTEWQVN